MAFQLTDDDRRAIDLLLSGDTFRTPDGNGEGQAGLSGVSSMQLHSRLESAERLLQLLQHLPAADPPMDLVARTLRRVDEAVVTGTVTARPAHGDMPPGLQRPTA